LLFTFGGNTSSIHSVINEKLEHNIQVVNTMNWEGCALMIFPSRLTSHMFQGMDQIETILQRFIKVIHGDSLALKVFVQPC
jgi:hypothetical protein